MHSLFNSGMSFLSQRLLLRLFPDVGVLGMAIPFSLVYKQILIYRSFRWPEKRGLQALAQISFDGRAGRIRSSVRKDASKELKSVGDLMWEMKEGMKKSRE